MQRGLMARSGAFIVRHRRWVALAWVLVILAAGYLNGVDKKSVSNSFRIPHADSQDAYDLLKERFTSQNAATARVVFSVPAGQQLSDADNAAVVAAVMEAIGKAKGISSAPDPLTTDAASALQHVTDQLPADEAAALAAVAKNLPPTVSANGRVAVANVSFDRSIVDLIDQFPVNPDEQATDYDNPYDRLQRAIDSVETGRVQVDIGGEVADMWNVPVSWWASHADEVGLGLGAVLLLVAFGSLFGMAIPIATALLGAITASGLVYFLASHITISSAAPPVTLMISLGVGLDYSLLIVTRYRQYLKAGLAPEDAVARAMGSAGKASMFAGVTVCVALLGLVFVPIPLVQTLGVAAAVGVAVMMVAALTLLPALLGFAGRKIDAVRLKFIAKDGPADPTTTFWGRFARRVTHRPWIFLVSGGVVLLVIAMPFLRIHFGMPDDSSLPNDLSQQQAFTITTDAFGPGTNGPLVVAVALPENDPQTYLDAFEALAPVNKALGALQPPGTVEGVEYSVGPIPNNADKVTAVVYELTPTTAPDDPATTDLVERLRADLAAATAGTDLVASVGGPTATLIDLTDVVTRYLPWVIGAVVLGAFILLVIVFRSILVPLKAAIMNLVSIAAAYGVVVAVFQWGWAKGAVGLTSTIPIVSFVPLVMFVILFGLSMDYEVFLMSRIKEEWDRSGDPQESVVLGVANTARVITTAALIMIVVFGSFVTNASPTVKLIGFGMAVAVLIDSTLLRMVMVPAVMALLGKSAWWFPRWLGWLPHLRLEEGDPPDAPPAPTDPGVAVPS
ncbi:MAG: MMPL family transporter [Actinobacteria bacterium]|nr:MMPL family transporter [Actinomycetota bacterium]